jgi:hypothetical protein
MPIRNVWNDRYDVVNLILGSVYAGADYRIMIIEGSSCCYYRDIQKPLMWDIACSVEADIKVSFLLNLCVYQTLNSSVGYV